MKYVQKTPTQNSLLLNEVVITLSRNIDTRRADSNMIMTWLTSSFFIKVAAIAKDSIREEDLSGCPTAVARNPGQARFDFLTPSPSFPRVLSLLVLVLIPRPAGDPGGEGEGRHDLPLLLRDEFNANNSTLQCSCVCMYVWDFSFPFFFLTAQGLKGNEKETQRLQRIITNHDSHSVPITCINQITHEYNYVHVKKKKKIVLTTDLLRKIPQ